MPRAYSYTLGKQEICKGLQVGQLKRGGNMEYCDKCAKELADERGTSITGIVIQSITTDADFFSKEFMQKQFGKYELDKSYRFCHECWLDSLFGK